MSSNKRKAVILVGMLKQPDKSFVCPACFKSYSRMSDLRNHLKQLKDAEDHRGLSEREESEFRRSYAKIIGWKPTDKEAELELPRERFAAFTRDVVVEKIASQTKDLLQSKIQIYLQIALSSGMAHVCPECVDQDLRYFNKMVDFDAHCWERNDQTHMGLLSKTPADFLPAYLQAMGLPHIEDLPPGSDKPGRWTNERYLKTAYVFQTKKRYYKKERKNMQAQY
ncbi:hypothetical protein N7481_010223 [Penicillium waksmanii]|uniref:uncharacterized protein n=1 Tax=Penicillium waksmanii TaxID=69791 RepID=UPI002547A14D|nr:uncharacterized protein N7481_010223 [Penicillium waksmanii]KAJ5976516.1 hypothetical protein N7481_010223 [Penicillium waksmanii]